MARIKNNESFTLNDSFKSQLTEKIRQNYSVGEGYIRSKDKIAKKLHLTIDNIFPYFDQSVKQDRNTNESIISNSITNAQLEIINQMIQRANSFLADKRITKDVVNELSLDSEKVALELIENKLSLGNSEFTFDPASKKFVSEYFSFSDSGLKKLYDEELEKFISENKSVIADGLKYESFSEDEIKAFGVTSKQKIRELTQMPVIDPDTNKPTEVGILAYRSTLSGYASSGANKARWLLSSVTSYISSEEQAAYDYLIHAAAEKAIDHDQVSQKVFDKAKEQNIAVANKQIKQEADKIVKEFEQVINFDIKLFEDLSSKNLLNGFIELEKTGGFKRLDTEAARKAMLSMGFPDIKRDLLKANNAPKDDVLSKLKDSVKTQINNYEDTIEQLLFKSLEIEDKFIKHYQGTSENIKAVKDASEFTGFVSKTVKKESESLLNDVCGELDYIISEFDLPQGVINSLKFDEVYKNVHQHFTSTIPIFDAFQVNFENDKLHFTSDVFDISSKSSQDDLNKLYTHELEIRKTSAVLREKAVHELKSKGFLTVDGKLTPKGKSKHEKLNIANTVSDNAKLFGANIINKVAHGYDATLENINAEHLIQHQIERIIDKEDVARIAFETYVKNNCPAINTDLQDYADQEVSEVFPQQKHIICEKMAQFTQRFTALEKAVNEAENIITHNAKLSSAGTIQEIANKYELTRKTNAAADKYFLNLDILNFAKENPLDAQKLLDVYNYGGYLSYLNYAMPLVNALPYAAKVASSATEVKQKINSLIESFKPDPNAAPSEPGFFSKYVVGYGKCALTPAKLLYNAAEQYGINDKIAEGFNAVQNKVGELKDGVYNQIENKKNALINSYNEIKVIVAKIQQDLDSNAQVSEKDMQLYNLASRLIVTQTLDLIDYVGDALSKVQGNENYAANVLNALSDLKILPADLGVLVKDNLEKATHDDPEMQKSLNTATQLIANIFISIKDQLREGKNREALKDIVMIYEKSQLVPNATLLQDIFKVPNFDVVASAVWASCFSDTSAENISQLIASPIIEKILDWNKIGFDIKLIEDKSAFAEFIKKQINLVNKNVTQEQLKDIIELYNKTSGFNNLAAIDNASDAVKLLTSIIMPEADYLKDDNAALTQVLDIFIHYCDKIGIPYDKLGFTSAENLKQMYADDKEGMVQMFKDLLVLASSAHNAIKDDLNTPEKIAEYRAAMEVLFEIYKNSLRDGHKFDIATADLVNFLNQNDLTSDGLDENNNFDIESLKLLDFLSDNHLTSEKLGDNFTDRNIEALAKVLPSVWNNLTKEEGGKAVLAILFSPLLEAKLDWKVFGLDRSILNNQAAPDFIAKQYEVIGSLSPEQIRDVLFLYKKTSGFSNLAAIDNASDAVKLLTSIIMPEAEYLKDDNAALTQVLDIFIHYCDKIGIPYDKLGFKSAENFKQMYADDKEGMVQMFKDMLELASSTHNAIKGDLNTPEKVAEYRAAMEILFEIYKKSQNPDYKFDIATFDDAHIEALAKVLPSVWNSLTKEEGGRAILAILFSPLLEAKLDWKVFGLERSILNNQAAPDFIAKQYEVIGSLSPEQIRDVLFLYKKTSGFSNLAAIDNASDAVKLLTSIIMPEADYLKDDNAALTQVLDIFMHYCDKIGIPYDKLGFTSAENLKQMYADDKVGMVQMFKDMLELASSTHNAIKGDLNTPEKVAEYRAAMEILFEIYKKSQNPDYKFDIATFDDAHIEALAKVLPSVWNSIRTEAGLTALTNIIAHPNLREKLDWNAIGFDANIIDHYAAENFIANEADIISNSLTENAVKDAVILYKKSKGLNKISDLNDQDIEKLTNLISDVCRNFAKPQLEYIVGNDEAAKQISNIFVHYSDKFSIAFDKLGLTDAASFKAAFEANPEFVKKPLKVLAQLASNVYNRVESDLNTPEKIDNYKKALDFIIKTYAEYQGASANNAGYSFDVSSLTPERIAALYKVVPVLWSALTTQGNAQLLSTLLTDPVITSSINWDSIGFDPRIVDNDILTSFINRQADILQNIITEDQLKKALDIFKNSQGLGNIEVLGQNDINIATEVIGKLLNSSIRAEINYVQDNDRLITQLADIFVHYADKFGINFANYNFRDVADLRAKYAANKDIIKTPLNNFIKMFDNFYANFEQVVAKDAESKSKFDRFVGFIVKNKGLKFGDWTQDYSDTLSDIIANIAPETFATDVARFFMDPNVLNRLPLKSLGIDPRKVTEQDVKNLVNTIVPTAKAIVTPDFITQMAGLLNEYDAAKALPNANLLPVQLKFGKLLVDKVLINNSKEVPQLIDNLYKVMATSNSFGAVLTYFLSPAAGEYVLPKTSFQYSFDLIADQIETYKRDFFVKINTMRDNAKASINKKLGGNFITRNLFAKPMNFFVKFNAKIAKSIINMVPKSVDLRKITSAFSHFNQKEMVFVYKNLGLVANSAINVANAAMKYNSRGSIWSKIKVVFDVTWQMTKFNFRLFVITPLKSIPYAFKFMRTAIEITMNIVMSRLLNVKPFRAIFKKLYKGRIKKIVEEVNNQAQNGSVSFAEVLYNENSKYSVMFFWNWAFKSYLVTASVDEFTKEFGLDKNINFRNCQIDMLSYVAKLKDNPNGEALELNFDGSRIDVTKLSDQKITELLNIAKQKMDPESFRSFEDNVNKQRQIYKSKDSFLG